MSSDIESSDGDSSSEGDDMPWQQMWLSSDSDLDYEALRKENNWLVSLSCFFFSDSWECLPCQVATETHCK